MTIARDTETVAAAYSSTGTQTTSHAGSANTKAVVVLIDQNGTSADEVSGVTYGGVAMTRLDRDAENTEAGCVYIYYLLNPPTGTQDVAMTTTAATNKQLVCATMTGDPLKAIKLAGFNFGTSAGASNPSWTISGLTAGRKLEAYEVIHSGLTTMTNTPAASWTLISSTDLGAQGRGFARQSVASSGTTLASGWTAATSDDYVGLSVAFWEDWNLMGGGMPPDTDASSFEGGTVGGWAGNTLFGGAVAGTVANSALHPTDGTKSLAVTHAASATLDSVVVRDVLGLVDGQKYGINGDVWVPTGSPDVKMIAAFLGAGAFTSVKDATVTLKCFFYADSALHAFAGLQAAAQNTAGKLAYLDNVQMYALIPVSTTRVVTYDVRAQVSTTRATTWDVLTPVSTTRATTWKVRALVSTTRSTTWNTRAQVSTTRVASWDVLTPVSTTRATTWNVNAITTTPVSTTRATTWRVRASVSTTKATTWRVLARVAGSRATTWDVLAKVSTTRATTWDVRTAVLTTRATSWRVLSQVSSARTVTYDVLGAVSTPRSTTWRVRATVTATRATSWDVLAKVTSTRATTWDVLAGVSTTRATTWRVLAKVTTTKVTTWNVASSLLPVSTTRSTTWRVRAQVAATRVVTWDVRAVVSLTRATSWDVLTSVSRTRATTWKVRAQAATTRTTTWRVLAQVAGSRSTTWVTFARVTTTRGTTWVVLAAVVTTRSTTWRVLFSSFEPAKLPTATLGSGRRSASLGGGGSSSSLAGGSTTATISSNNVKATL